MFRFKNVNGNYYEGARCRFFLMEQDPSVPMYVIKQEIVNGMTI